MSSFYVISEETKKKLDRVLAQIENLTVKGGTWTPSDTNAILEIDAASAVDGYDSTEVTLCVDGAPVTGTILFNAD